MVAYFRFQNLGFMILGGAAGVLAGWGLSPIISAEFEPYIRLFIFGLFLLLGVVLGRIVSGLWAGKKCRKLYALLYQQEQPKAFLTRFSPLVSPLAKDTIAYIDGMHQIAYAYEAMGETDKALEILCGLEPEKLKLHYLAGNALVTNHKLRLYLLRQDIQSAGQQLDALTEIAELARNRAPALAAALEGCLRVGRIWLRGLAHPDSLEAEDVAYIREEEKMAGNPVYRRQMQNLLCLLQSTPISETSVSPESASSQA